MTNSAAGLAALALFVLVLGYWVPLRVRQRQELAESRTDDRFSVGLRVLAVAAQGRVPAVAGAGESMDASGLMLGAGDGHETGHPQLTGHSQLTGHGERPGSSVTDLPVGGVMMSVASSGGEPRAERPTAGRHPAERPIERPVAGRPAEGRPTAARAATDRDGAAAPRTGDRQAAAHRNQLAARARRASRRLRLTLLLVAAVAATGSAAAAGVLPWWALLAPAVPLACVLVLGRLAAASARRADARWAAEQRAAQRRALQARALAAGGPRAPRNRARVTGHAVRGSSAMTQALRRVEPHEVVGNAEPRVERERTNERPAGDPAATSGAPASVTPPATRPAVPAASSAASSSAASSAAAPGKPVVDAPVVDARVAGAPAAGAATAPATDAPAAGSSSAPAGSATPSGTPWEARPVPLPTYVTKPEAPRREPRPLTGASPVVSTGWSSSAWQRLEDPGETVGEANTSWSLGTPSKAAPAAPEQAADDALRAPEPRPVTETLGLPLEQILARRRAAG